MTRANGSDAFQKLVRLCSLLNADSRNATKAALSRLSEAEHDKLMAAITAIESHLNGGRGTIPPYLLRSPRPGDFGWIVHRHGVLYAAEYDWDESFEALVARIVAQFVESFDDQRDRCWIAERDGEVVGSTFVVGDSEDAAKLRLVYVEPTARGLGIGRRLVDEAIGFARRQGYTTLSLWTNDVLVAARRIYEAAGFHLVKEEEHHSFGHDLVGQYWSLDLK